MFGITILAAGRSQRMGQPKVLLPWGRTSVLGHLIGQWQKLGAAQITVVYAAGDASLQMELDRIKFPGEQRIMNIAPERGMFSSIQCAAQWKGWNPGLTHFVIALGDQPHLPAETLRKMIEFSTAHPEEICLPLQGGHRRHPVWLPARAFLKIAHSDASDLRDFLAHPPAPIQFCEMSDASLELDIDYPEDYERAKQIYLRERN
jgi:molybdenum cofactor cytidylyltransferase